MKYAIVIGLLTTLLVVHVLTKKVPPPSSGAEIIEWGTIVSDDVRRRAAARGIQGSAYHLDAGSGGMVITDIQTGASTCSRDGKTWWPARADGSGFLCRAEDEPR